MRINVPVNTLSATPTVTRALAKNGFQYTGIRFPVGLQGSHVTLWGQPQELRDTLRAATEALRHFTATKEPPSGN